MDGRRACGSRKPGNTDGSFESRSLPKRGELFIRSSRTPSALLPSDRIFLKVTIFGLNAGAASR